MDMTIFTPSASGLQPFMRVPMPGIQAKGNAECKGYTHEARVLRDLIDELVAPEGDSGSPELSTDDAPQIGNTADVAYQIKQIHQLLQDAEGLKSQAEEAQAFYERRIEALETRATMLKENCGRFLKMNDMKRLVTHAGTIFFSKRTKVTLPDDETLIKFASEEDPSHAHSLVTQKPNKSELKKYIQSTGHAPQGYLEEPVEHITIRKVA
jgi:hypothetical protein